MLMRGNLERKALVGPTLQSLNRKLSRDLVWSTNSTAAGNVNEVLETEVGGFENSIDGNRQYSGSSVSL